MTREHLDAAREHIEAAADAATHEDAIERLRKQADEFGKHATGDHGPDHGRLARHERILTEIAEGEGGTVESELDTALDEIRAYRETIDGV